jgi:hypothetical protein
MRMYTCWQVNQFLRPVAACILLLFGSLPAATLACQWACVPDVRKAHHHGTHQTTDASDPSATRTDGPSLASSGVRCDHAGIEVAGVTSTGLKLYVPVAVGVEDIGFAVDTQVVVPALRYATHSPPGGRSGPLALRI